MPRYTERQYRENAALHMASARQAIASARQARQAGCHETAVSILNAAQNYRRAYQRRMRQAALARQAEQAQQLAEHYRRQAEQAAPSPDRDYCQELATELNTRAIATFERAFHAR